jgi:hypothetical protein
MLPHRAEIGFWLHWRMIHGMMPLVTRPLGPHVLVPNHLVCVPERPSDK